MLALSRNLIRHRELIWLLALKELKVRYKRSVLGFFWALLHPLLMMIVLTVVFSTVIRFPIDHYAVFLISALFPWIFFSQSLAYAVESVVLNGPLLKKVYVPRLVFPVAAVTANLINFLLSLGPLALLLFLLQFPFHTTWLYLPVPLLALVLFTLGFGFFFAAVNVFFRDMAHILQILLTVWFYFSPILYSIHLVPPAYRFWFRLNPMLYLLEGFRLTIYDGNAPPVWLVAISLLIGLAALMSGFFIFRHYDDAYAYYV